MTDNKKREKRPELLAPCGSPEALTPALEAGADAVYFGGTVFNARMNARNFGREEIREAATRCHAAGARAYVTLNTQIYDRELKQALEYAAFLCEAGVDALIVSDPGLALLIRRWLPDCELHASTQMTVHNLAAAETLYDLGFSRVVGARELSEENIRRLCCARAEIEVFVHGAICVSCSGQCLMSAMLGGRSGNRGECAQPCRMSYNGSYPLSLKDLCLAGHIPALIDAGVASLKIEGRRKSPAYVGGVTKIYRRLLDERRSATAEETAELQRLFSRGGFTDGYYTGRIDRTMLGIRGERDKADTREADRRLPRPAAAPEKKPAVGREKSGAAVVLPAKLPSPEKRPPLPPEQTASFRTAQQIPDSHDLAHVYLPLSAYEPAADGVILPPVIFDSDLDGVRRKLEKAATRGAAHLMIGNIGQLSLAEEFGLIPHGSFRLNIFNGFTGDFWSREIRPTPASLILSCELILPQIRDVVLPAGVRKGAVVYGRLPLMLLEKPVGAGSLRDTRGAVFPVMKAEGRELLLNSVPLYMADQIDRLDAAGIEERHFLFTVENRGEVMRVLYAYAHRLPAGERDKIRRLK